MDLSIYLYIYLSIAVSCARDESTGHDGGLVPRVGTNNVRCTAHEPSSCHLLAFIGACSLQQFP